MLDSLLLDPTSLAIGAVLFVFLLVVIGLFIYFLFCKGSKSGENVLLVGLSEAGKTHIFLNLVTNPGNDEGRSTTTYTSLQENVFSNLCLHDDSVPLTLVDVPGADKLRGQVMEKYLSAGALGKVRGLVFVIDAATFAKSLKDVAELLYELLCHRKGAHPPLAILAHKQDLPTAKSAQVVRSGLEKEFRVLEKTRAAALDSTTDDTQSRLLGAVNWDAIEFLATSGLPDVDTNLKPLRRWLLKLKA